MTYITINLLYFFFLLSDVQAEVIVVFLEVSLRVWYFAFFFSFATYIYFSLVILLLIFTGICTTTDVDVLLNHMNNARYLREIDFARADFYERTNLYREIRSQGSGVVQGAATIRYRRFIRPLTIYKITSKVELKRKKKKEKKTKGLPQNTSSEHLLSVLKGPV